MLMSTARGLSSRSRSFGFTYRGLPCLSIKHAAPRRIMEY